MIDYEQEIETRLERFRRWNGRGNVRESGQALYEIIELMLGMMNENKQHQQIAEPSSEEIENIGNIDLRPFGIFLNDEPSPDDPVPSTPIEHSDIGGDHIEISSEALQHPETVEKKPKQSGPKAPHGFTRFGNPRRIRKKTPNE